MPYPARRPRPARAAALLCALEDDGRESHAALIRERDVRRGDAFRIEIALQRVGELKHRLAGGEVAHPHAVPVGRRLDAGAERLGEGLLGGEALGEVVRRQPVLLEAGELRRTQDAPREALAVALERRLDARDVHHIRADPKDHRAARSIKLFISRTASRMPTTTARLTMAWPMCSSRTPFSAAIGCTLK